ncbi:PHP domain-containing protein [Lacticaseibacillus rhamnosus]
MVRLVSVGYTEGFYHRPRIYKEVLQKYNKGIGCLSGCLSSEVGVALRYDNWKIVFAEQRQPGTLRVWSEPFVTLRVPKIFNLRTDPFERADITSIRLPRSSRA